MTLFSFASWSLIQGNNDDDWADRVSHLWTVGVLALFAVMVSSVQYVGDPIQCWCPSEFTAAQVAYVKSVCWTSNTYFIPIGDTIPSNHRERTDAELSYYQWVPIIFLFQALMFKIPNLIWRMLNNTGGLNMDKLVQLVEGTQIGKPEDREKITYQIAKYLDRWLKARRQYHYNLLVRMRQKFANIFCFWFAKREGKYFVGLYVFIKGLYVANVIGQFYLLNAFLSTNFSVYGFEVMHKIAKYGEYTDSHRFPRITLCDFDNRQLSNIHRYTVQCVLPINLFNEKIFIFLWFWLVLVAVIACGSYALWLYYVLIGYNRLRYVKKYLKIGDNIRCEKDSKFAQKFADEYLRDDGVFVLRVLSKNSSEIILTELVNSLWILFRENPHTNKPRDKRHLVVTHDGKNLTSTLEIDDGSERFNNS
uniref:Innexin n=1 Tax=Arion vulgaris TaxID=1028688 RepID=A0A0B7AXD1_9EUPU